MLEGSAVLAGGGTTEMCIGKHAPAHTEMCIGKHAPALK